MKKDLVRVKISETFGYHLTDTINRLFRTIRAHFRRANTALAVMPETERAALLDFLNDSTL